MSTLSVGTIQSNTTTPPTIQNSSGTEIGTFCRAWVNFDGTGTVAIRAAFNVSSITDNGTGNYTANFTNAMPDANYCCLGVATKGSSTNIRQIQYNISNQSPTSMTFVCREWLSSLTAGTLADFDSIQLGFFR